MTELLLARAQFGLTTVYHYFFVPLTLGLGFLIAFMETQYVRKGDEHYKQMTKFWGKLFLINFALGVVTGIVQEFQFGMNWSGYSRFVGDIFGVPLAIEALLAFFLESTFLGIWIFGWDKISKKLHLACIWIVALASSVSAFWILVANSFMQNPVGYEIVDGVAQMTSFTELITNQYLLLQYPHVLAGGLVTGAFFLVAISAINMIRKNRADFFKKSMKYGLILGIVSLLAVMGVGHAQGQQLMELQPMKMAAAEGLWETEEGAGFSLFAIIDQENGENTFSLTVPYMFSIMGYNDPFAEVQGINDLNAEMQATYGEGDYVPSVTVTFWSFRAMVGAGMLMFALALLAFWLNRKGKLEQNTLVLKALGFSLILPYVANTAGWILAETGRQPWLVYGLQLLEDGVSTSVPAGYIGISLVGFFALYVVLATADVILMKKYALKDPLEGEFIVDENVGEEKSLWI